MKRLQGVGAAPGYAAGPAVQFRQPELTSEPRKVTDAAAELRRLDEAQAAAAEQIRLVKEKAEAEMPAGQAAIFEAQLLMLQDPELVQSMHGAIQSGRASAESAVSEAVEGYARQLESMEDAYFRARAVDVRDVGRQLLALLLGVGRSALPQLSEPCVVIAKDLAPSETIAMDKAKVLGFCTVDGSETSHTAILARGLGIPAVVGAGEEILDIAANTRVILNGRSGEVLVDPDDDTWDTYQKRRRAVAASQQEALRRCQEPAVTQDGRRVEVVANIGSLQEARPALEKGAEGVGLLRSEFLYMERNTLPTEDEQYQAYAGILGVFGPRPVVLRTSDIGGDKALPYLQLPREANPFLGLRGLRLALRHPDALLKPQLRAALRAGEGHDLRLMFPMVAALAEIRQARQALRECREELREEGHVVAERMQVGIMVEVPAAALLADLFAPEVDFFSIGTNDLTQYTLAADRTNPALAHLASAFSPAVLRLVRQVIVQAHKHGKWVGVCGELAGEPLAIPILLGMGLDEFSMNAPAIPVAKQIVRELDVGACQGLVERVLALETADAVREHVRTSLPQLEEL